MKTRGLSLVPKILPLVLLVQSLQAATQIWDPDGTTVGSSVAGNWDTTTANWTAAADSGINTVWAQGNDATFGIASNYAVTLVQPITLGSITVVGSAGTLTLSGSSANSLNISGPFTLDTGGRNVTISAPIHGNFSVSRIGGNTVTLSGASSYLGGTFLYSGTTSLAVDSVYSGGVVSGPFGTGPVTLNGAVTISPSGARVLDNSITMNASLTIGGSAPMTIRNGTITIAGDNRSLTINDSADVTLQSTLLDDGTPRILTKNGQGRLIMMNGDSPYLGAITATTGTLVAGNNAPFPTNSHNIISFNGATLDLNGFNVRLSRLAGTTLGSVLLGTNTLTFINNGPSGAEFSGVISGSGGLVKLGVTSQVLSGTNTFTGGITISEGALYLPTNRFTGSPIALGAGTNTITITGTGRIGANRNSPSISIVTNNVILATVGPAAGLDPANGGVFVLSGKVIGSGGFLRYSQGSGFPALSGDNTFTGGVQIDARSLGIGHKNALGVGPLIIGNPTTPPANTITIIAVVDVSGANAITNPTTINQSFVLVATNGFGLELNGPCALSNAVISTSLGDSLIKLSGNISGPGGITKAGTNAVVLSGSNTYEGATIVADGALLVNNLTGSATGTNAVTVSTGGTLGGHGTVAGAVTVGFGARLSPGNSVGRLAISNSLSLQSGAITLMELDRQAGTNDSIVGMSSVTYGGALVVTNLAGTLGAGDTFTLFSAASYGGTFDSVELPPLPGSLTWDTNNLAVDGTIKVSGGGPSISSISVTGASASVSGSGGTPFGFYTVLVSTNVVLPLNSWTPLTTNQFDSNGNFNFGDTVSSGVPQRFYALRVP